MQVPRNRVFREACRAGWKRQKICFICLDSSAHIYAKDYFWLNRQHVHIKVGFAAPTFTLTCDLGLLFAQTWNSCMGRHRASTNTMLKSLSQYHPYSLYSHSGSQLKWECPLSCHLVSCFQRQHKFEFPQT